MDWKTKMVPRVVSIPPSGIRKFFDLASAMDNVISLGVGEPDFNAPDKVIKACIASLEKGETSYTGNAGILPLREEIAKLFAEHYGVEYDPKTEITVTIGVSEAIDMTLRALLNPGDEVLIPDPAYVAYPACVTLAGGTPVLVPTRRRFPSDGASIGKIYYPENKSIADRFPEQPDGHDHGSRIAYGDRRSGETA